MVASSFKWVFRRGQGIMRKYGVLFLLLAGVFFKSANGYLSSAHVGQDPAYTPQHGPGVPGPVGSGAPAAAASSSSSSSSPSSLESLAVVENHEAKCPSGGVCNKLPADCFTCAYHHNCSYGKPTNFTCKTKKGVHCVDASDRQQTIFNLTVACRFCWQLDPAQYRCNISTTCMTVSCPRKRYNATCTTLDHVNCLGKREFQKRLFCNWTGGYKWSTALTLRMGLDLESVPEQWERGCYIIDGLTIPLEGTMYSHSHLGAIYSGASLLPSMHLGGGTNLDNPEETHAATSKTCETP